MRGKAGMSDMLLEVRSRLALHNVLPQSLFVSLFLYSDRRQLACLTRLAEMACSECLTELANPAAAPRVVSDM